MQIHSQIHTYRLHKCILRKSAGVNCFINTNANANTEMQMQIQTQMQTEMQKQIQKCNSEKSAGVICCSGAGSFHGKVGQICALHCKIIIITSGTINNNNNMIFIIIIVIIVMIITWLAINFMAMLVIPAVSQGQVARKTESQPPA